MSKKPILDFFNALSGKARFPACYIFNDLMYLMSLKMAMHPCITRRLLQNCVLQQPA